MKYSNKALGQGLSSLINDKTLLDEDLGQKMVLNIPIQKLKPNSNQPRKDFKKNELQELSDSIASYGIIQPIVVEKKEDGYQIVAGERRWRAASMANLAEVPVIINHVNRYKTNEIALVENIQRQDLNPVEEAMVYVSLIKESGYTHEKLAKKLGKSRSHITNYIRLTSFSDKIKSKIASGEISVGHAKLLLNEENPDEYIDKIINSNISVRELENLLSTKKNAKISKTSSMKNEEISEIAKIISNRLKVPTSIKMAKKGGRIELKFDNLDQLDHLITLLCKENN